MKLLNLITVIVLISFFSIGCGSTGGNDNNSNNGASIDTSSPTTPNGFTSNAVSTSQINLSWNPCTDNVGVAGYRIYRGGVDIGNTNNNSYGDTGLNSNTQYCYMVFAYDAAGNESARSQSCATTHDIGGGSDTSSPTTPNGFTSNAVSTSQINLSWDASTDDVGVEGYKIYRDGIYLKSVTDTSTSDSGLSPLTNYCYTVSAYDAALNESNKSNEACATTTGGGDTSPPSVPTELTATADSSNQINLSWDASTDDVGVEGYKIYRDGIYLKSVTDTSTSDSGLSPLTNYCYTVSASDAAGNESGQCDQFCVTTSSQWTITTIDGKANTELFTRCSLTVDSNDKFHISYTDFTYEDAGSYVTWYSSSKGYSIDWPGDYTSIVTNSQNTVYLVYLKEDTGTLEMFTNTVGGYQNYTIDSNVSRHPTDIAVDSNDKIHITYWIQDLNSSSLIYITNRSGAWLKTTIDTHTTVYGSGFAVLSLAIDSNNKIHISYRDPSVNEIKYATNISGQWAIYTIDNGKDLSLAIDSNNKAHIVYVGISGGLIYTTNVSGTWQNSLADSGGTQPSLSLDINNKAHISYISSGSAKYVTNISGLWKSTSIEEWGGASGYRTSIAIDTAGYLHICYTPADSGGNYSQLNYATNKP